MRVWRDDAESGSKRAKSAINGTEAAGGPLGPAPADPSGAEPQGARHRHGDQIHAHTGSHPHVRGSSRSPSVGIVGAGPVGLALGVAISRAGWSVVAVSSRDEDRRDRFAELIPGSRAFMDAVAVVDEAELTILTVPDDAIPGIAETLRLYGGQTLVHTSGLLGPEVLEPALAAGSHVGSFHPLVSFTADIERSVAALNGATIALEGDDRVIGLLADLGEAIGGVPVRLPAGSKPAYHAAAVLASGGLVALLDAIVELAAVAGMDEKGAISVYGRLIEQTLANARSVGVAAALTGPITRGDAGTLQAHLAALARFAPGILDLYLAAARREAAMADERGALAPDQLERVLAALAKTV